MKQRDYLIAILSIGIAIGYYYCADSLQATEVSLKKHPYFLTSTQFNLLYFSGYFAQFLLLFPVGILVDAFPLKTIMISLILVTFVSESVISLIVQERYHGYVTMMYVARGFLGIGGLGIITIQGKLVNKYSKRHYEYIMGLCLNIPYLFNALNSFITAFLIKQTDSIPLTFFIGSFFCLFSLFIAIYVVRRFLQNSEQNRNLVEEEQQGCSWKALKEFRVQFWVLVLSIFFTQASINPIIDNLTDYFSKSFGIEYATVGSMVPILFIGLTPFSLALGKIIQIFPAQKRNLMVIGKALYLVALIVLYQMPKTDSPSSLYYIMVIVFLLMMSFNWAVFHSIVEPCIAYYVQEQHLGTAWGIVGSTLGLCQSIFSLVNIWITSSSKSELLSYSYLMLNYIVVGGVSLGVGLWIRCRDYSRLDSRLEQKQGSQFSALKNNE